MLAGKGDAARLKKIKTESAKRFIDKGKFVR